MTTSQESEFFKMNTNESFADQCAREIDDAGRDQPLREESLRWMLAGAKHRYTYHFTALGRPIIQFPQDMVAMQELIWSLKPDLVIETGIAHGGSLIMSASMLALLDYCDALAGGDVLDPSKPRRKVLGMDIDIRPNNRAAIAAHPMANRIEMIEGSSIAPDVIAAVQKRALGVDRVLVCLDSNHTHDHVLSELEAYAPLVTPGSYCVVFDTIIEDVPAGSFPERPWDKGNNPKTAVWEYLRRLDDESRTATDGAPLHFEIDKSIENKLLVTVAPDGYLKRVEASSR
jgi:cephalosporin hydroxylase